MGDRANVLIIDRNAGTKTRPGIFIYSHGAGEDFFKTALSAARASRSRLNDTAYFTRMVIDRLSADALIGGGAGNETGMGVGLSVGDDNTGKVLVLDPRNGRFWYEPYENFLTGGGGVSAWYKLTPGAQRI